MVQPNILFIMTDQLRYDALGCTGGYCQTPHLDRLAAGGQLFHQCITNSPLCVPARMALATGQYPHNSGIWDNIVHDMPADTPTWMQAVRAAGHRTSLFGKTHLHRHQGDLRDREHLLHSYGLDDVNEIGGPRASRHVLSHLTAEWEQRGLWQRYRDDYRERYAAKPQLVRPSPMPLDAYADVYVGQQAQTYLHNYDRDQPWLCWVSFGGPHEPWDAPEPYASRVDPAAMPPAIPRQSELPETGELARRYAKQPVLDDAYIATMRANYAANVAVIDDQIGELLATIEARGELEHTAIVFTSDHGEMNGDHGLQYKSVFFDAAVRIPLIFHLPNDDDVAARGCGDQGKERASNALIELMDLGPTLVDLARGEIDYQQHGRSLAGLLHGQSELHRDAVVAELRGEIMIMNHDWKMVIDADGQPSQLFDRHNDPEERHNLAADPAHSATRHHLSQAILAHLLRTRNQEVSDAG